MSGWEVKNNFVLFLLFSKTDLSELVGNLEKQQRIPLKCILWTSSYSIATEKNKVWGFLGDFVCLFVSLHKLFGESIFFSRQNLCHLKSYDFDDSLDIDTLLRMYFPFNECFDVVSMFSVFHVCIFHGNSFAVI